MPPCSVKMLSAEQQCGAPYGFHPLSSKKPAAEEKGGIGGEYQGVKHQSILDLYSRSERRMKDDIGTLFLFRCSRF